MECMRGHEKTDPLLGVGLTTPGVEIYYPLSPDLILIMVDGDYHKHLVLKDRRYAELEQKKTVEYYNVLSIFNAERFIISDNNDFSTVEEELGV